MNILALFNPLSIDHLVCTSSCKLYSGDQLDIRRELGMVIGVT
jgi:hypothetical protein